nr:hypothetical protein [Tanacetum cinerariifolium]
RPGAGSHAVPPSTARDDLRRQRRRHEEDRALRRPYRDRRRHRADRLLRSTEQPIPGFRRTAAPFCIAADPQSGHV